MLARFRYIGFGIAVLSVGLLYTTWGISQPATPKPAEPTFKFSGPYTHDNLTIFLVHGEDRLKGRKFMMLADALEKKVFVIHETQSVNQLTMENNSNEDVLILSGDILKGGQQDRIAQFDQLVPAKSGKIPLTVFCVEHTASRWGKPLTKEDETFHSNPGQICSNGLRLASRYKCEQGQVWSSVAKAQKALSMNAGTDVKDKASDSSLALSLKVKEVQMAIDKYLAKLEPAIKDKNDVVGFVVAINGKVYAADIYGSPAIFGKAWPQLIRASAIEAFADLQKETTFTAITLDNVKSFLKEADGAKQAQAKDVGKGGQQVLREGKGVLRFDSNEKNGAPEFRRVYLAY